MSEYVNKFHALFDNIAQGAFIQGADGRLVDVNPVVLEMFGISRDEFLGRTSYSSEWRVISEDGSPLPPDQHPSMLALHTGKPVKDSVLAVWSPKRCSYVWLIVNAVPIIDEVAHTKQVLVTLHDITERKRTEDILAARIRLLEYATTHTIDELLQKTLDEAESLTGSCIGFYHFAGPGENMITLHAWSTRTSKEFCKAEGTGSHYPVAQAGIWADCIRERRPVIHNDYASLPHRKGMPEGHAAVTRELVVPVLRNGMLVAALGVGNKEHNYDQHDVDMVSLLADLAWDTVERKLAEARYRELFDKMLEGFALHEIISDDHGQPVDYRFITVNPAFEALTGLKGADIIGRTVLEIMPKTEEYWIKEYGRVALDGDTLQFENYSTALGKHFNVSAFRPAPRQFACIFNDITERKRAEIALSQSEEKYRIILENVPIGMFQSTIDGKFVYVNPAMAAIVRYESPTELMQVVNRASIAEVLYENPLLRPALVQQIENAEGEWRVFENRYRCKDGVVIDAILSFFARRDPLTGLKNLYGFVQDITERKKAEQELRYSYDLMSYIIKHNTSALAVHDKDLKYLFVSERYLNDYKVKNRDIIGRHHYEVFPDLPQKWKDVHQKALSGIVSRAENDRYEREDGSVEWTTWECRPWYEANGEVGGFVLYTEVVTDRIQAEEQRRQLQEQLHQSQKMEAIGQLAGGVAHDFNNILQVIAGYCSLFQLDTSLDEEQKKKIDEIAAAAEKAAQLTRGLLTFSRKQPLMMKHENLNEVVQHVHKFLKRIIGEDITLNTSCIGPELGIVADRGQIEQVLINLATNARDAMPHGGTFTIKSELVNLDSSRMDSHKNDIPPGKYALMTVCDSGSGIQKELLDHIFEPFFTTKEVGKGTGLGMAIIYGIIRQHNGFINVCSEPDKGATFQIYLPIHENDDTLRIDNAALVRPSGGTETILVVEDDPAVRMLTSEVLARYGYEVILAEDGLDAIEKFMVHQDKVRLILMDMIMPKKNGVQAFKEIQRINPEMKVIFASGYTADFIKNRGVLEEGVEVLMKPVSPNDLLRKVREMLDAH